MASAKYVRGDDSDEFWSTEVKNINLGQPRKPVNSEYQPRREAAFQQQENNISQKRQSVNKIDEVLAKIDGFDDLDCVYNSEDDLEMYNQSEEDINEEEEIRKRVEKNKIRMRENSKKEDTLSRSNVDTQKPSSDYETTNGKETDEKFLSKAILVLKASNRVLLMIVLVLLKIVLIKGLRLGLFY